MKWRRYWMRWGPASVAGALCITTVILIAWLVIHSSRPTLNKPAVDSANHNTQAKPEGEQPKEAGWWRIPLRTIEDPVALWTFFLVVFTGVLSCVSMRQFKYLRRADQTARLSANAAMLSAKISQKVLTDLERPHLCLVVKNHNFREFLEGQIDGVISISRDGTPTIRYCFKNYGKSPAILRQIALDFVPLSSAPAEEGALPVDLPNERIIGPGESTDDFVIAIPDAMMSQTLLRECRRPGGPRFWFYGLVKYGSLLTETIYDEAWLWSFNGASGYVGPNYEGGPNRNRHT